MFKFDELNWFVAILEGEGSFYKQNKIGHKSISIEIYNTDKDIINKCSEIISKHTILHKIYPHKGTKKSGYRLVVSTQDCYNLYTLINSKMECRKNEYQRIINKNETSSVVTFNFSWLIGIIEAEGTLYFIKRLDGYIYPRIQLCNTNDNIINKAIITFNGLNCAYNIQRYEKVSRKPIAYLELKGLSRCLQFLNKTIGLWQSNRNILRSKLMLEFINSRMSKYKGASYSFRENEIYQEIKLLN